MKNKIIKIAKKLELGKISEEKAKILLLNILNVNEDINHTQTLELDNYEFSLKKHWRN